MKLGTKIIQQWHNKSWWCFFLWPLSIVFRALASIRRLMYEHGLKAVSTLPVPMVVVGNITVGGTGKTPVVIALAKELCKAGYKPGIISRGYKSALKRGCVLVKLDSDATFVGDEPILLRKQSGCPVAVGSDRVAAARLLLSNSKINIIISDDGLQHYRLSRDIEVVLFHGKEIHKNNFLLPAGPFREPLTRLQQADFILSRSLSVKNSYPVLASLGKVRRLHDDRLFDLSWLHGKHIHAICAIGTPHRFFNMLRDAGIEFIPHIFPDHYYFEKDDLVFDGEVVLMTEKDAVKCTHFSNQSLYSVALNIHLSEKFISNLLNLLKLFMYRVLG